MIVPVQIRPNGGIGVEVFFAVSIPQHRAFALNDYNRLALEPVAHLRERMPDVCVVELHEFVHGDFKFGISDVKPASARVSVATSSAVCAAVSVTRNRAAPRATVG